jgi:eukaryotic-like serine/threonine-protein kinase
MVQQVLPGPTLQQRLAKLNAHALRLDRQEILSIASQMAAALDTAHAAGIVHRNVTPGSIMWNPAGAVVLSSFGIARDTLTHANLTQAGVILGTPYYLSPEQALGKPATSASDIYALGVVLYELIAGAPPFTAATPLAIGLRHVQDPPPPLYPHRHDLPPAVDAVMQRALAKEPALRFPSAGDLAHALAQAWPPTSAGADNQPLQAIQRRATQVSTPVPATHRAALDLNRPWLADPQAQRTPTLSSVPPSMVSRSQPARNGASGLLPILALLLVVLLLGGTLLAWRSEAATHNASPYGTVLPIAATPGDAQLDVVHRVVSP